MMSPTRAPRAWCCAWPTQSPTTTAACCCSGRTGLLYIGTGDGGGGGDRHGARGNAQSLGTLLGKILRIDPRASAGRPYSVPRDNPFVARAGAKGEIYSYGLRNPWRFSFDRETGDLTIGDVGQNAVEEISFVRRGRGRGANFGWRPFEGNDRYTPGESAPGHIRPAITERHSDGNCSITGGVVIRDPALGGLARALRVRRPLPWRAADRGALDRRCAQPRRSRACASSSCPRSARTRRGRVYATSLDGPVYRLVAR